MYAAETSGRYSSVPNESLETPEGSPSSGRGSYATADAARVGGGLYAHLLESICTLATDPAPSVARMGNAVLRVAGVQLMPIGEGAGKLCTFRYYKTLSDTVHGGSDVASVSYFCCKPPGAVSAYSH